MKTPHPYQREAVDSIIANFKKGNDKQALILPTGGGKTYTASLAIKELSQIIEVKHILWIVHTEELGEQGEKALLAELELDRAGIIKAEQFDIDYKVVIASAQTLHRRLERLSPDYFDIIVADECDLFGAASFQKSLNYFRPKLRLGLTATFFRMDNMPLTDLFDVVAYEYTLDRAIKEGFLANPDAIQVKTSADLDSVHTIGGEFNQKELTEKVNTRERNNLIVSKYLEYGQGKQFVAFCCDVTHTVDLCGIFQERGINCEYVVGDKDLTTDRKGTIDRFKAGEIIGLTNCMILSVGFDHADIGVAIMAAPTKSRRKFIQQVGRALRLKSPSFVSKWGQKAIILDVVDTTTRHKLINTKELDHGLPIEKKIFISEENRQLLLDVKVKREQSFTVAPRLQDIKIDLFELPVVKIYDNERTRQPATEKQLEFIAKFGYDIVNVFYSNLDCQRIIASQSASDKQISMLKYKGYDVSNGVTISEAKLAFKEIEAREEKERIKKQTQGYNLPFGL